MRYLVKKSEMITGFFWCVEHHNTLDGGWSSTYDQAFRDCRNFIKRNQEWLYR